MCHAPVKQTTPNQNAATGDAQEGPPQEAPPEDSSSGEEEEEDEEFPGEETEEEDDKAQEEEQREKVGDDEVQSEKGCEERDTGCGGDAGATSPPEPAKEDLVSASPPPEDTSDLQQRPDNGLLHQHNADQ